MVLIDHPLLKTLFHREHGQTIDCVIPLSSLIALSILTIYIYYTNNSMCLSLWYILITLIGVSGMLILETYHHRRIYMILIYLLIIIFTICICVHRYQLSTK